jgi:hypothetical protein
MVAHQIANLAYRKVVQVRAHTPPRNPHPTLLAIACQRIGWVAPSGRAHNSQKEIEIIMQR